MLVVRLLGQFSVQLTDRPIDIPSRPAQTLFAYLILNPGTTHRRERLAGLLWPDANESNARSNLRHTLWRIRKALGDEGGTVEYFVGDDLAVSFNPDSPYWLDVALLEKKTTAETPLAEFRQIVSAYGGEFLPGFYDDWITLERERLQALFEQKMELFIERLVKEGHWREVIEQAERWIALGHAPEPAYRALMSAHYKLGNRSNVKATYQRCVETLQKELGVEPSEQTRMLYQRLVASQPLGPLPAGVRVEKAAAAQSKPLPRHNLPPQATPLIGRAIELAEITDRLVNDPACRLLTIVGPGGIGKTRLAIQAALENLAEFPDGVFFVSLAPIKTPESIPTAIMQAASVTSHEQKDPRAQLIDYLREKRALLVLDNAEHLLSGVDVLGEILAAAPDVKLIATSRERLHLTWEWLYELHGLEFPEQSTEAAENFSAVQLFVQTARRIRARFSLADEQAHVVRICQLVEGMPLGIEMAASWVRVLSCQEIVRQIEHNLDALSTELQDVPDRHRSIRAAFEYSWNLLVPEEQTAFTKLSVFPGGFRREAAEKVAGAPLSLLFTLVDKSLLRVNTAGRYDMHSLLRQYVGEKLQRTTEESAIQTRLIDYYLDFAHQYQNDYTELEEEWINLMACLQLAQENWMAQAVMDYANALSKAMFARGRFTDARRMFAWACDAAKAHDDEQALAKYLRQQGEACIEQGEYEEAEKQLKHSLELSTRSDDQHGVAYVKYDLARLSLERSDHARASQLLNESLSTLEQTQDQTGIAEVLHTMAWLEFDYRHIELASTLAQRALKLREQIQDPLRRVLTLHLLADIALHGKSDLAGAERFCLEAQALCLQLHVDDELAAILNTLAEIHRLQGQLTQARSESEESLVLARHMGSRKSQAHYMFRLSKIDADATRLTLALQEGLQSLSLCRTLEDSWGTVYVLEHLGQVYLLLQQPARARDMWAEALTLAQELNHPSAQSLRERLAQSR